MTYTIAISNEKGGVAKTTTTVSLGASLAEAGLSVLLVDLDPQANLTLALGIEPVKVVRSTASLLLDHLPVESAVLDTGIENLSLVPSKDQVTQAERALPLRSGYESTLKHALEACGEPYDFILLDCPPSLGVVTLNAFVAADLLLIPTQAEYFSIYALRNLMGWIKRVRSQYNPSLVYRLLLTMYDRRNRTHRVLSEQLRESFNSGVLQTIIETDTKLRESPIAGLPVLYHAPRSRATAQYRALAQEIIEYVKETTVQPA